MSQPERETQREPRTEVSADGASAGAPSTSPERSAPAERPVGAPQAAVACGDFEFQSAPSSRLLRDEGGPVFAEPWQAQAFAMAVKLSEQGHFTWKEWAAALSNELKAAADRGEPDDGTRYYEHWLAALERLVVEKGLSDRAALAERKNAWIEAYKRTPHGKPVELNPRTK